MHGMATEYVAAPMPGVFYRRTAPDEPALVEVGDEVSEGDTVALIGVMKNFHDITVPSDGVVADILIENEAEVEAGQDVIELTIDG